MRRGTGFARLSTWEHGGGSGSEDGLLCCVIAAFFGSVLLIKHVCAACRTIVAEATNVQCGRKSANIINRTHPTAETHHNLHYTRLFVTSNALLASVDRRLHFFRFGNSTTISIIRSFCNTLRATDLSEPKRSTAHRTPFNTLISIAKLVTSRDMHKVVFQASTLQRARNTTRAQRALRNT